MSHRESGHLSLAALCFALVSATLPRPAIAQNIRGSATGPTSAKGYSHPDQFITVQDVAPADNMYPAVPHE